MTTTMLRKKLHSIIDTLPEKDLETLHPLLSRLSDISDTLIIETDLTKEEHAQIEAGVQAYKKDPSSFVPLESIL